MRVAIQRPLEDASGRFMSYVNSVFEVEFKGSPPTQSAWAVVDSIREVSQSYHPTLPFLHKGYFDSHLHVTWMGLHAEAIDLSQCTSLEALVQAVQKHQSAGVPILRGFGWDESKLGVRLEDLSQALNGLLPEKLPILLHRVCAHSAIVNQKLRDVAGLSGQGFFVTDRELFHISRNIPQPNLAQCKAAFLRAQDLLLKSGISAVGDMSLDETSYAALREICEEGKLQLDVCGVFDADQAPSIQNFGPLLIPNKVNLGPLDRPALLSLRHCKRYLDGSFGSRSAWLSQPYADAAGFGESLHSSTELIESSREIIAAGFHLSFHAIGDAALDQALQVGEHLFRVMDSRRLSDSSYGLPKTRHRIEHGQLIRDDQLQKLSQQNFWAICAQPHHREADAHFIRSRLGAERLARWAYRAKSLWGVGVPIALSSDAPIDAYSPGQVLASACRHQNAAERLNLDEALWAYTTGSRLQLGLDPGRIAANSTVYISFAENIL